MTERSFFPLRRENHTDAEWHEAAAFLASHQLDPHNIPAGEQIVWDDDAQTITIIKWLRDENGRLRMTGDQPMGRPVTIHASWDELPTTWREAVLGVTR